MGGKQLSQGTKLVLGERFGGEEVECSRGGSKEGLRRERGRERGRYVNICSEQGREGGREGGRERRKGRTCRTGTL